MMGLAFISSCSEYNEPELSYSDVEPTTRSSDPFQEEGRFDNEPFNWDYSFSTDSLQDIEGLAIYPVETVDSAETSKRLVSRGRTTRPGGSGTGNHRPGTSTSVTIIRKTKCSYFPKRNVLPPKTKRTFFSPLISDRHNPFQGCGGSIFMRL